MTHLLKQKTSTLSSPGKFLYVHVSGAYEPPEKNILRAAHKLLIILYMHVHTCIYTCTCMHIAQLRIALTVQYSRLFKNLSVQNMRRRG